MAVITVTDYKSVMNDYAAAQDQLVGIADNYYNAAYTILLINVFDPEIDLLIPFNNAYLTSQTAYNSSPSSVILAVDKLQRHVLNQGKSLGEGPGQTLDEKYDEINNYYADYDAQTPGTWALQIPATFASLSASAGHAIDTEWITL